MTEIVNGRPAPASDILQFQRLCRHRAFPLRSRAFAFLLSTSSLAGTG